MMMRNGNFFFEGAVDLKLVFDQVSERVMDKRSRRSDLMSPRSAREFEMQRSRELRRELDKERDPSQPSFQTVADVLQAQTQMDDVRRSESGHHLTPTLTCTIERCD